MLLWVDKKLKRRRIKMNKSLKMLKELTKNTIERLKEELETLEKEVVKWQN